MKNKLETTMEAFFHDPDLEEEFYNELFASELFVLTPEEDKIAANENLSIANFTMEDGTPFMPVFTSVPELQRSIRSEYGYMGLRGWDLFSSTVGIDVVINPANEKALHLTPEAVELLLEDFDDEGE